jgi:hypothetical protein
MKLRPALVSGRKIKIDKKTGTLPERARYLSDA